LLSLKFDESNSSGVKYPSGNPVALSVAVTMSWINLKGGFAKSVFVSFGFAKSGWSTPIVSPMANSRSDIFDVSTSGERVDIGREDDEVDEDWEVHPPLASGGKRSGKQMTGKFQNVLNEFEIKIGVTSHTALRRRAKEHPAGHN
jgi:hypothetical protein